MTNPLYKKWYLRFPIMTTFEFPGSFPVGSSKFADTRGCDPRRWLSRRRLIETSCRALARFDCFRFRVAKHSFNVVCANTAEITGESLNMSHIIWVYYMSMIKWYHEWSFEHELKEIFDLNWPRDSMILFVLFLKVEFDSINPWIFKIIILTLIERKV